MKHPRHLLLVPLLLGALLIGACSCQQRLQRLMVRCPECFLGDTVRLADTLVPAPVPIAARVEWADLLGPVPVVVADRQFTLTLLTDSAGLNLEGEARPDTVVRTVEVPVRVPVVVRQAERQTPSLWWGVLAVAALALLLAILRTLKRKT